MTRLVQYHIPHHVPGSRGVLNDGLDLATVIAEADVVGTILLHGDGALKRSVPNSQSDAITRGLLDGLANLVCCVACHNLTIDLQRERKVEASHMLVEEHSCL